MRKAKYFLCAMLILCGLVYGGELYQSYLFNDWLLDTYELYVEASEETSNIQRHEKIKELADNNDCNVFNYTVSFLEGKLNRTLIIYCDEATKGEIINSRSVKQGTTDSLFSGSHHIIFKDYFENDTDGHVSAYFFIGKGENISMIRSSLIDEGYVCSSLNLISNEIHGKQKSIDMLIWVAFGVVLLAFTWIDIQFKKKERLVLLSLGKPVYKMVLESIIADTVILLSFYFVLYAALSKITCLQYLRGTTFLIFIVSLFANSILIVLVMSDMDVKKALSSYKSSSLALANAYLIKTLGVIVTIIVLSMNIIQIRDNTSILVHSHEIDNLDGYSYISIVKESEDMGSSYDFNSVNGVEQSDRYAEKELEDENAEFLRKINREIFIDKYSKNELTFGYSYANMMSHEFLAYERSALYLLDSIDEINTIDFTKDIYVLLPEDIPNDAVQDIVDSALSLNFEFSDKSQISYDVLTYKGSHNIFYFKAVTLGDSEYFGSAKNPVITIYNLADKINDLSIESFRMEGHSVFYKITQEDIDHYTRLLFLEEQNYSIVKSDTSIVYRYGMSYYKSLMLLNVVITIFMMMFELMMIVTIIKAEFMSNSIEMSLKKVFGYSLLKRNRSIFFLYTFGVFIGAFITTVAALLLQLPVVNIIIAVCCAILITEYLVMTYYIHKVEKIGVAKILKGGCL